MHTSIVDQRQRGSVLIISLIMLVVLTLLAVSAINMSTAGLRVVNAMQTRGEALSAAQRCVEQILSSSFAGSIGTIAGTCTIAIDAGKSYDVTMGAPCLKQMVGVPNSKLNVVRNSSGQCTSADCKCVAEGYWSDCADTVWDLSASVNEGFFGAHISLRQGIALRMDNSAALAYSASGSTSYICTS